MGNYELDPVDDYPDFAQKVAQAVLQRPDDSLGVVICGSGVGVSVATNRHKGIRCALGFEIDQVHHARENDHINILAIPSDYAGLKEATQMIEAFMQATPNHDPKYHRRIQKLDALATISSPDTSLPDSSL